MDQIIRLSNTTIANVSRDFTRSLDHTIEWQLPLKILKGPRGVGKTTLLLQDLWRRKEEGQHVLYCTLDHPYFGTNSPYELASQLDRNVSYLYLDEIHKYQNWSQDLKLIHDTLPQLRVMASGSSILDILKGEADLSRRVASYHLPGLSFREYLMMKGKLDTPLITLPSILADHVSLASNISEKIPVLKLFKEYLLHGYYPFFKESLKQYPLRLLRIINTTIENDIPAFENVDYQTVRNLKKLLYFLAQSGPVSPNVNKLSGIIGVSRTHLLKMFDLMQRADLVNQLRPPLSTPSRIAKPDKLYLHNTNFMAALTACELNIGQVRETYFLNQLKVMHEVHTPPFGDFLIDREHIFEVGGLNKSFEQIGAAAHAYLAIDDLKVGQGKRIPLWLFGFTY